ARAGAADAPAGGAADAGRADPVGDASAPTYEIEDAFQMLGQAIGHVQEAEIAGGGHRAEVGKTGFRRLPPVVVRRVGAAEARHGCPAVRSIPSIAFST